MLSNRPCESGRKSEVFSVRILPDNPNIDHLRRQAKDLLAGLRESAPATPLSDAQSALAGQYGFRTWTDLKAEVDRRRAHVDVADPTVAEAVAECFGLGRVTGPMQAVVRNNVGRRWSLATERGRWVVQGTGTWMPIVDAEADVALQEAAAREGILLPAPVRSRAGAIVEAVGGHRWRVYEWIPAGPALVAPVNAKIAYAVGEILARIHRLALPVDRISPPHTRRVFDTEWPSLVSAAQATGADWAPRLAEAIPALVDLEAIGQGVAVPEPVLCHNTLGPANVLRGDGGRLVVVDWEHAGGQPPGWELCAALMHFVNDDAAPAVIDGYQSVATLPPLNLAMFRGAAVCFVNYVADQVETAVNAEGDDQHQANRSVRHLLSGRPLMPTPDGLQRRLDAALRNRRPLALRP
jgi:Ser/Thr protein kinase RdoA (MazF antagonist)